MKKIKKRYIIAIVALVVVGAIFSYIDKMDKMQREYNNYMEKTAENYQTFMEMTEAVATVNTSYSFEDITGQYEQLRTYLSDWNYLSFDLAKIDKLPGELDYPRVNVGDFTLDLKQYYYGIVRCYYIKDGTISEAELREKKVALDEVEEALTSTGF